MMGSASARPKARSMASPHFGTGTVRVMAAVLRVTPHASVAAHQGMAWEQMLDEIWGCSYRL